MKSFQKLHTDHLFLKISQLILFKLALLNSNGHNGKVVLLNLQDQRACEKHC